MLKNWETMSGWPEKYAPSFSGAKINMNVFVSQTLSVSRFLASRESFLDL